MSRRRTTPQSVVTFALEQQGKTRQHLEPLLGSKGRVSEFLAGKRRLSLSQIAAVRKALRIPADLLIETSLELDDPVEPPADAEPRVEQHAEFDALLAAQRDFIVRLNRMIDEATRSMGKRW